MKKMLLTILASFSIVSVCAAADTTYVCGSDGKPLMIGDQCVVANGSGDAFEECGSTMAAKPAEAAQPKIVKKVIVDCTQCNGTVPKPGVEGVN